MPLYARESLRISTYATKPGTETRLGPADVDSVTVEIRDADLVEVVAPAVMVWEAAADEWAYYWVTTAIEAGTYRAKCTITGPQLETFEYLRIRLREGAF